MPKYCNKLLRSLFGEQADTLRCWRIEERAVLPDNKFKQICTREDCQKLVKLPAGDQQQLASRKAAAFQSFDGRLMDSPMQSQGAVIIAGEDMISNAHKQ